MVLGGNEETVPFQYSTMGIYLVIEANNGLIFIWDRKTSLFIKLSPKYKVTLQNIKDLGDFNVTTIDFILTAKGKF